ncbi:metalloregulator ArsR/SmtB family transcription factor [Anaerovorax odorimutans]|uniref:Metalloregulator ArsR/SmtB family transcription factor n=1 Tax=Anaerovorax odorimutans TaxID=109327 RepID=A0ABT1RQQ5_9FIRM|nr:metalloregulator ArsR/SmtB family transcription factor [Anaerovorax odorimutans]MCQ4637529.1 metalloregulator ArsR/SmtB family transcription factor [Anaerovorax odorimutans]
MEKECEERLRKIINGFQECRSAFTAIGDETRQLILLVLLESDLSGIRVGEIAEKTHLTRPSVSHHLQILKESGIVAMRREGTKNYYYLSADETRWKEIADLTGLIYASVRHISSQPE